MRLYVQYCMARILELQAHESFLTAKRIAFRLHLPLSTVYRAMQRSGLERRVYRRSTVDRRKIQIKMRNSVLDSWE